MQCRKLSCHVLGPTRDVIPREQIRHVDVISRDREGIARWVEGARREDGWGRWRGGEVTRWRVKRIGNTGVIGNTERPETF